MLSYRIWYWAMKKYNFKNNIKNILKKGKYFIIIFLGRIENTKEQGKNIFSKMKEHGKEVSLFLLGIAGWLFILLKKLTLSLWQIGRNTWENIKKAFYSTLGILVALFCVSLFLFFVFVLIDHISPTFITSLHSQYILLTNEQSVEISTKTLGELIAQGKIVNASEVYNHMLEYYNTIITILIALLGVFGAISWFTIQGKAHYEVKTSIENKFDSTKFKEDLAEKIDNQLTEMSKEQDFWDQIYSKNKEEIVSCILMNEQFRKLIQGERDDILSSHNKEVPTLKGVDNGDEV